MLTSLLKPILGPVVETFTRIIDKVVPDVNERERIKAAMTQEFYANEHEKFVKTLEAQTKIILAEATGNWLQRSWRPVLMWVIVTIIANNYVIVPYLSIFTTKATMLSLPAELWSLMTLGVGGYIGGRTVEKAVESWKGK